MKQSEMTKDLKGTYYRNTFSSQASQSKPQESEESTGVHLEPLWKIYDRLREDLATRGTEPKYPIGLSGLDQILFGVHKKEVMVVGGRPSMGKSAFVLNIVKNLADQGIRVAYFSLEMTSEQLVERLVSNMLEIDNQALRHGKAFEELKQKENLFKDWAENVRLLVNDKHGYTPEGIYEVCNVIKPEFIIIDYVQMVRTQDRQNKKTAIEEFLLQVKEMAMDKNIGVIFVSQVNREGAERPSMNELKHSGVLEEMADSILLLQWLEEEEKYFVHVAKQRHGPIGKVQVSFYPQFSKFTDLMWTDSIPVTK